MYNVNYRFCFGIYCERCLCFVLGHLYTSQETAFCCAHCSFVVLLVTPELSRVAGQKYQVHTVKRKKKPCVASKFTLVPRVEFYIFEINIQHDMAHVFPSVVVFVAI